MDRLTDEIRTALSLMKTQGYVAHQRDELMRSFVLRLCDKLDAIDRDLENISDGMHSLDSIDR